MAGTDLVSYFLGLAATGGSPEVVLPDKPVRGVEAARTGVELRAEIRRLTDGGKKLAAMLVSTALEEGNTPRDRIRAAGLLLEYILPKKVARHRVSVKHENAPTGLEHLSEDKLRELVRLADAVDVTPGSDPT